MYVQKVNKCRTLAEFNSTMIPASQTDNTASQQTNSNQEASTAESNQAQKAESKQSESNQQASEENNPNAQSQAPNQYLYFGADEFLITVQSLDSGWWYGYKDTNSSDPKDYKLGFFPSTFVQVIEKYENQVALIPTEASNSQNNTAGGQQAAEIAQQNFQEPQPKAAKEKDSDNNDWIKYAHSNLVNDQDLIIQARLKRIEEEKKASQYEANPDGIVGYKKIKIHESLSHSVNSSREGEVKTSTKAIKDQSPLSKSFRLMNHYFDYDSWNEQMNRNPPKKSKGDANRKKSKTNKLDW